VKVAYVDTSVLAAIAFAEPGHEDLIDRLDVFDLVCSSNLLEAELRAAFQRESVADDGAIMGRLAWVLPDRPLTSEITIVLGVGRPRGADLWHLACALYLSPDPRDLAFLTVDRSQAEVASGLGFR
jgi:PIN domain